MNLTLLPGRYAVCRLAPDAPVPAWAAGAFVSVTRTPDELSVVCDEAGVPADVRHLSGWCCLQVQGPLDFALTGVLSGLAAPLAADGVSIFAVSTFDTDYLLVRAAQLDAACAALEAAGYLVFGHPASGQTASR